jgi:hypothetical protein
LFKIFPATHDLTKRWFVYWTETPTTGKPMHRKEHGLLNKLPTVQECLQRAKLLIKQLQAKHNAQNKKFGFYFIVDALTQAYDARLVSLRRKTKECYKYVFNKWLKWCDGEQIQRFTTTDALKYQQYLAQWGLSNISINTHIILLHSLFNDIILLKRVE